MATVGSIVVNLVAKTAAFRNGMAKSALTLKRFGSSVANVAKRLIRMGAIAATAVVGGLVLLTRQSLIAIDATTKLADALGLTTQQLSAYQHIAGLSGVSTTEIGTAFRKMEKNISDATLGLTTAVRAFDAMGLSAENLKKLSPDQQFKAIADAFQSIPNQVDKARVAQDLFGRSGLAMIKVMELGSEGIEKLTADADKLGITFDRSAGAKIEKANDAILRMKSFFVGLGNQIAINVAPLITALADKFTKLATSGAGVGPAVVKGFGLVVKAVGFAANIVQVLRIGMAAWRAGAMQAIATVANGLKLLLVGLALLKPAFAGVVLAWAVEADKFAKAASSVAADLAQEFEDQWNQPWASDKILKSFEALQREADKNAAGIAKAREDAQAPILGGIGAAGATTGTAPSVTQFNRQLVSFSAGATATQKGKKGDPEQTQFLAQIEFNTRSPMAVLGP